MDQAQLIEKRLAALDQLKEIVSTGKTEKRKLSTVETRAFETLKAELTQIDAELKTKTTDPGKRSIHMKTNETPNFSLLRAIRSIANGEQLDENSALVNAAGKAEMRKSQLETVGQLMIPLEQRAVIAAGDSNSGSEAIQTDKMNMLAPLRDALVLVQAGATFMTGLTGNLSIPKYAGSSVAWKGEKASATDGAGATSSIELSPKRLTGYIDVTKQFLLQDSVGAEALLMADIVRAISGKLEGTILGKEDVSATQPGGFFYAAPSIKGSASWANIVGLETAVDTANALTTAKYICGAAARGILKKTVKVANQATYLMDPNGQMNGYPTLVTNAVASALQTGGDEHGIIFGDWSQLIIGQWGAIDLLVDPYTQAGDGKVRIVVNAYFDAKARFTEAFKTGSLK